MPQGKTPKAPKTPKTPARPRSTDPLVETILDLRDRVTADAKIDPTFVARRAFVLLSYTFQLLARRRRHLGEGAVQTLAPWLAKLVRSQPVRGGFALVLTESFWDFASDDERAWLAAQPALAPLVPPSIADVIVNASWHVKQRAFTLLRVREPARARALLESPPEGLTEADRRNLIGLLREGLSEDDREFLEREQSTLLAFLPGSSLWMELAALAGKLMTIADGKLRLTPPERFEEVFHRLGLEERKAAGGSWATLTVPQYWLYQLVRVVPLAALAELWKLEPGTVVDLFLDDAEHARYRWALYGNVFRLGSAVWSRAILDRRARFEGLDRNGLPAAQARSLARSLPPREREAALDPLLDDAPAAGDDFADALEHIWSPPFTRRMVVRTLRSPAGPDVYWDPSRVAPLVHHGNSAIGGDLGALLPDDTAEARAFRDDLAAAWRERDGIVSRF